MSLGTTSQTSGSQGSGSQATGTQVTVLRAENNNSLESLNNITNSIRARANQLSQSSSGSSSDATRNWIQAEKDLFRVPEATLCEDDQQFNILISAAGLDSSNMEVIATSNSLTVRGTSTNSLTSGGSGNIVYSDVDSRMTLRRFDLPSSIDNRQVSAADEQRRADHLGHEGLGGLAPQFGGPGLARNPASPQRAGRGL